MNLLLLHPSDLEGDTAVISGRRAEHIQRVLKKSPGDTIETGIAGRGRCEAQVSRIKEQSVHLVLGKRTPTLRPNLHLVLALPRPKVISRIVQAASSFGVGSITLINAWRVEKSYFDSPRLSKERLLEDATLGCEQGQQCWLPDISIERSFRRYIEDVDPERHQLGVSRIVLHPYAQQGLNEHIPSGTTDLVFAIGPEGGFIASELSSFERAGYRSCRLHTGPLKTEVALAAALGQVALVQHGSKSP